MVKTAEAIWATGRRKTAIARVRLFPGSGKTFINDKSLEDYFGGRGDLKQSAIAAFQVAKAPSYDAFVNVTGGGIMGQAEAIRHAISRGLARLDPKIHKALRAAGFLTRDSRMVERKKYGQPKARKRFQYSKR